MKRASFVVALLALFTLAAGCASTPQRRTAAGPAPHTVPTVTADTGPVAPAPHIAPPTLPPARDVHLPAITRATLPNGLETNLVEYHTLPVLHLRLVIRSAGSGADPANLPGLATFLGDMLKEGTRRRSNVQIAEAIDFVGGTLEITTTADATTLSVAVLRDHAETALALLGEMVAEPAFPPAEIVRLRRREVDRLTQSQNEPRWLSRRALATALYAGHPYGHYDTTPEALARITRADLQSFHRARYLGGSMYLVAVGDVRPADFDPLVARTLGRVARGAAPAVQFPAPPAATTRQIVLVDRPDSAQSDVRVGNVALRRNSDEYIPLSVANHALGGDASSRLFVDLRERRSLGYGAYSHVAAAVDLGAFEASGSFRTEVTGEAVGALLEHLERLTREALPADELARTQRYLVASFALGIETPGDLADLVSALRLYGLPDTYWETYRGRIAQVAADQALTAARAYVHPERAVVVVVGDAAAVATSLQRYGAVHVVDAAGHPLRELPATAP